MAYELSNPTARNRVQEVLAEGFPIIPKPLTALGEQPSPGDLVGGQLAVNINPADRRLYAEDAGGSIFQIGPTLVQFADGLATKADLDHTHTLEDLTDVSAAGLAVIGAADEAEIRAAIDLEPGVDIPSLSAMNTALGEKANAVHTHLTTDIADSTSFSRTLMTTASASALRTAAGLVLDTDVPSMSTYTAGLAGKAASTHTHTASQISDSTTTGRSVLTAADAAAVRTAAGLGTMATQAASAVAITGGTANLTNVVLGDNSSAGTSQVILNGAAGYVRQIWGRTAGVNRWVLRPGNGDAESTGDAGSNFVIQAYSDAGSFIYEPLKITRATGLTTLTSLAVSGTATVGGSTVAVLASPAFTGTPTAPTGTPGTGGTQIATQAYADAAAASATGIDVHAPVVGVSVTNVTISSPGSTIGGVSAANGDRFLLTAQSTGSQNGIYVFNGSASAMTRATDADATGEIKAGTYVFCTGGTYANTGWICQTTGTITIGSTTPVFVQFSSAGTITASGGLQKVGSDISIASNAALPGAPTTTTASAGDNTTKIATMAALQRDAATLASAAAAAATSALVDMATSAANTLGKIETLLAGKAASSHTHSATAISDSTATGRAAITAADAAALRTAAGIGTIGTQNANAVALTGGTITGITDLAVADGGTGASTAAAARVNLGLDTMATQAASAVAITGGTAALTNLTLGDNASAGTSQVILNGAAGYVRQIWGRTAGVNRWVVRPGNNDAESTGNAGSNFVIQAYSDTGSFLYEAVNINRATGLTTLTSLAVAGSGTLGGNPIAVTVSPVFSGTPRAPTPAAGVATDQISNAYHVSLATTLRPVETNGGSIGVTTAAAWVGYSSLNAWTVTQATKAKVDDDKIRVTATATNPAFLINGLSIDGSVNRYVAIRLRRTQGTHEGNLYFATSGHGFTPDYRKSWSDPGLNVWKTIVLDMWLLTSGGSDWKNNTITGLRIDPGQLSTTIYEVGFVSVGPEYPLSAVPALAAQVAYVPTPLTPEMFGAIGNAAIDPAEDDPAVVAGVVDDTAAVQAMFDAVPAQGGVIQLRRMYKVTSLITVTDKAFTMEGVGTTPYTRATGFSCYGDGGFKFTNCSGADFKNVKFEAMTGKTAESYLIDFDDCASVLVFRCLVTGNNVAGTRLMKLDNQTNRFSCRDTICNGAMGDHAIYHGQSASHDYNTFSVGGGENTDLFLFNEGNSTRFTNFAILFGRKGIKGVKTGILYFAAGGWENGNETQLYLDDCTNVQIAACYLGSDNPKTKNNNPLIYMSPKCGDLRITGSIIQGGASDGITVEGQHFTAVGCHILRTGNSPATGTAPSPYAADSRAGIRIASGVKKAIVMGCQIGSRWQISQKPETLGQLLEAQPIMRYGVYNDAPAKYVVIQGNIFTDDTGSTFTPIGGSVTSGAGIANNVS